MHRGSSKGAGAQPPAPGTLPLSASSVEVTFEIERAARAEIRTAHVARGTTVRLALRSVGLFGEGSSVLDEGRSVPLDTPLVRACRLSVVPTFSGG